MLARIQTCAVQGIDGILVAVEVDHHPGEIRFVMVGLPDAAVKESQERVASAIKNSGFRGLRGINVVNLAPADIRKEGSALDLPIALGLLAASEQIDGKRFTGIAFAGELALDGSVRPVAGALCMAIAARDSGFRAIVLPAENVVSAGVVPGIDVIPVASLNDAAAYVNGQLDIAPHVTDVATLMSGRSGHVPDLTDVKGQAHVKRALTVAAAGGHNLLMIGPPGTGKSMLASRLPGILPDMTFEEALETTRVYSVSALNGARQSLISTRPFRAPHHTATTVSIVGGGGGQQPFPGEVSLAHNGVLFLDELPEFNRAALEVLRQPLEERLVHIRRAMYSVTYPSAFMLVVAMNPCPCGCRTDPHRECRCSVGQIQRYMSRLSGPLLDRIDIHVDVPALSFGEIADMRPSGSTSAEVRAMVQAARDRQRARYKGAFMSNAQIDSVSVRRWCALNEGASSLLETAIDKLGFSARAYDKVLRVARTLADLECMDDIAEHHVAEAIQYRNLDRAAL